VLLAVKQDGHAMSFASRELRNDKEIVLAVMQAHEGDGFVQAASCRAIARLTTHQPELQNWFGAHNGCEAVVRCRSFVESLFVVLCLLLPTIKRTLQ
jgi:hypothetical protein